MSAIDSPLPHHPQDSSLLNTEQLESMVMLGAADYLDLIGDVIESVPGRIRRIGAAIQDSDGKQLRAETHSLQGMVSFFGCEALIRNLIILEQQPLPDPATASEVQAQLQALWQQTLLAIRQWEKTVPELAP